MSKAEAVTVKDVVHKLQFHLLEGIEDEEKLFVAGSVLSRGDYHDVVTERSIGNMCGYPLCKNSLPLDRPKKGRYRISLKEHKVYDLQETYMYCSTGCVVNSLAFAGSIQEERSSELNPRKLNQVLGLFVESSLRDSKDDLKVEDGKSGQRSDLRIKEKFDVKDSGEVSMEEWVGPSNAIDGYVPQRDQLVKPEQIKKREKGTKAKLVNQSPVSFNATDFTSVIIMTQDEYSVSKGPGLKKIASDDNTKDSKKVASYQQPAAVSKKSRRALKKYDGPDIPPAKNVVSSKVVNDLSNKMNDELMISDPASSAVGPESEINAENPSGFVVANGVKSSLKLSNEKKNVTRSVTWADEKNDGSSSSQNLCSFNDGAESSSKISGLEESEADGRYASAEACALALSHAADAVSSGSSDVSDAVAEAGIVILPPDEVDESETLEEEEDDLLETEQVRLKWPREPGLPDHNVLDSNDSLYDTPPEGFSLSLSPFATMFMALFGWVSSSSLAYIYGHNGDESFSEDHYSCVNGREYPSKVVLADGRSTEIKIALAGCLARTLPGLITDLRIPMPVSSLEKELGHLLDTMTFMDALPPFRLKQWQLVVLLFLDALSVCRIPELSRYIATGRRIWLPKIMEGARISGEEFEMLKDILIPLGRRVPQFASQSGG